MIIIQQYTRIEWWNSNVTKKKFATLTLKSILHAHRVTRTIHFRQHLFIHLTKQYTIAVLTSLKYIKRKLKECVWSHLFLVLDYCFFFFFVCCNLYLLSSINIINNISNVQSTSFKKQQRLQSVIYDIVIYVEVIANDLKMFSKFLFGSFFFPPS